MRMPITVRFIAGVVISMAAGACSLYDQPFILDAPSALSYSINTYSINAGLEITPITPVVKVYGAKTCSSIPSLPAGLALDPQTCSISGTPGALVSPTAYTITAANRYGQSTGTLTLEVKGIVYGSANYNYLPGIPITAITPVISGAISSCTINPPLPNGLAIDGLTCAITGTATAFQGPTQYTITAQNGNGTTLASVNIAGQYSIGGTISGLLTASSIVLRKQNGDDLTVGANGSFTFLTGISAGDAYNITILTQPATTVCIVQNGTGTAANNVTNILVTCPVGVKNGLLWMRCTHGQIWNTAAGDCTGTGSSSFNVYGAQTVQYCSTGDNACNDANPAGEGSNVYGNLNGSGSSSAWDACNNLNAGAGTYGKTTWRVPRKSELAGLITGSTNPTIDTAMFANTIYGFNGGNYFTASTYNPTTTAVWYVIFSTGNGAVAGDGYKTSGWYVRCVSNP